MCRLKRLRSLLEYHHIFMLEDKEAACERSVTPQVCGFAFCTFVALNIFYKNVSLTYAR